MPSAALVAWSSPAYAEPASDPDDGGGGSGAHEETLAGHDGNKFFVASADGKFRLALDGQVQLRYVANLRERADASPVTGDLNEGFVSRRVKLGLRGHMLTDRFEYFLLFAANRSTNNAVLEAVDVSYSLSDRLVLRAGRMKAPFLLEWLVSSRQQLATERSATSNYFNVDYAEGASLELRLSSLRAHAMLNDGAGSGAAGAGRGDFLRSAALASTGRVEIRLTGEWRQTSELIAWHGEPLGAFLGAAVHYEVARDPDPAAERLLGWTADLLLKPARLTLLCTVTRFAFDETGDGDLDIADMGVVAQAGYAAGRRVQPFVRYERVRFDPEKAVGDVELWTAGANYFFARHRAKLTGDVMWAPRELHAAFIGDGGNTGQVLLPDAPGSANQLVARLQFHIVL